MDFFTIQLEPGMYDTPSERRARLYVPLNELGHPIASGWGHPRKADQFDGNGRLLRRYYAGRRFEVLHLTDELFSELGLGADRRRDLMIEKVIWLGTTKRQNLLGAQLYDRVSSETDLVLDPSAPPTEFLEEYNDHFRRVTHRYKLNGDRITDIQEFLSNRPLVTGRYLYAKCYKATCDVHTLQDRDDRMDMPHIEFHIGGGVELVGVGCATVGLSRDCVTVDSIMQDLANTAAVIDALNNMLIFPVF
nr:hypothetical protein [Marivita hallyeonensis]